MTPRFTTRSIYEVLMRKCISEGMNGAIKYLEDHNNNLKNNFCKSLDSEWIVGFE